MKKDLFCDEELATVLKRLKNNKAPGADSVVNEFLNVVAKCGLEIRYI